MFGSSATKLFSAESDIDMCLILPPNYGPEGTVIKQVSKLFRKMGGNTHPVVNARVPILKLEYPGRYKSENLFCLLMIM